MSGVDVRGRWRRAGGWLGARVRRSGTMPRTTRRRWGWVAVLASAATLAAVLLVGVAGWANRAAPSCTSPPHGSTSAQAWRTGAFRAAGCRMWHRMHPHRGRHGSGHVGRPHRHAGRLHPPGPAASSAPATAASPHAKGAPRPRP